MDEKKKMRPEIAENKSLTDDQLEEVTGGILKISLVGVEKETGVKRDASIRRCAANPEHRYMPLNDVCPYCGCKEFISD